MSAAAKVLTATSVRTPLPIVDTPILLTLAATVAPAPVEHTVHWFRKGLRLHDNPALKAGLVNAATFRGIFLVDPWFASSSTEGINKWRFLLQCLQDLDASLKKLNSRLFVVRGQPADVLPKLFKEWGTTSLTFEEDPEPYGRVRDYNITSKCREIGVKVITRVSHTLYKLDEIIENNGGKAPLTYHQFQALIAAMPAPRAPEPAITLNALNGATTPVSRDHDDRYGVPTLEELGFETDQLKPPVWVGGESEALARLERHLERKAWVATCGRPKMTPQSLLASKTGLSPYLRFGCLSTRLFYYQLTELYERMKKVRPPLSLHGQILWREFFYCAATRNPNFDRMKGNPICVQIPWEKDSDALTKWENGNSGFPWIDAIMIQLRQEGWIHHLSRHAVACFLTRGDLWISWEEGMRVFDEFLLDADWSVNAGMWMWLSCSSFFQQFFHCYCPVRFGRKTDPKGDFIRRYIPVLKDMPSQYIHEPWMAPLEVQEAAKCIVGRDYPMPMVDHAKASEVNIERMKQVYEHLSQFHPQDHINPNAVQRPNATLSSPSPTSIIASVNQSNFLCSQTSPIPAVFNDSEIFQRPLKLAPKHRSDNNKYKESAIVHKVQKARVALENLALAHQNFLATSKIHESIQIHQVNELPALMKPDNYELAIINHVQAYSAQKNEAVLLNHKPNPEQVIKINNFIIEKKYYVPVYLDKLVLQTDTSTNAPNPVDNSDKENSERQKGNDKSADLQTNDTNKSYIDHDNSQNNQPN